MTHILIVEGNSPEIISADHGQGAADIYAKALMACDAGIVCRIVKPYEHTLTPADLQLQHTDGVVFTGSSVNWSTADKQAAPLRKVMEQVFAKGIPTLGSCNGLQLATVVLGGRIEASANGMELGIARDIRLTKAGLTHALHKDRHPSFVCPCMHRDQVSELPTGAVLTATNSHSLVQAMTYETNGVIYWGMQYHPEVSPLSFAQVLESNSMFGQNTALAADMRAADADPHGPAARRLGAMADDLEPSTRMLELRNWLSYLRSN